ncbi:unnamed protein product [Staurois parvus]|uniref:Uncharacterized protein n=1 Tax=Staurois parvus TaxID=386267 RepID=A0ABN9DLR7_9NEOB|nr:unnamed protein product [Staurois parvus]
MMSHQIPQKMMMSHQIPQKTKMSHQILQRKNIFPQISIQHLIVQTRNLIPQNMEGVLLTTQLVAFMMVPNRRSHIHVLSVGRATAPNKVF